MIITIKIATDNEAFAEQREIEIARIIREWLDKGIDADTTRSLYDINGSKVGAITVEDED